MKHMQLKLSIVALLILGTTELQAQTMYVRQSNGAETTHTLNDIQKMTFLNGNLIIQNNNNSTNQFAINGLRHLVFTNLSTNIDYPTNQLFTYPNPVTDVLYIDLSNEEGKGILNILTLEGKILQTQRIIGNNLITISLSNYPKGMYLCQYLNSTTIKTVKIVKQ